jgi:septal ring factor EnvC (AmiA/AmiB activator)
MADMFDGQQQQIDKLAGALGALNTKTDTIATRQDEMAARQDEMAERQDEMAKELAEHRRLLEAIADQVIPGRRKPPSA